MHRSWVSEIENGRRRVDVDDLIQLGAALDVSPVTLLMPPTVLAEETVSSTPIGPRDAADYWAFLVAEESHSHRRIDPPAPYATEVFRATARPRWAG